jgi:eukaryotic-like serine/threonine-protein kinase
VATATIPPQVRQSWDLGRGAEIDRSLVAIESLGGGTRYEVYRAWDRELFCQVAAKVLRPHRIEEDRVIEGFEREISVATRLHHPNLARLLRWSAAPPRPYMVFEFVSAPTLADHLDQEGTVSIPEACLLGIRVLSALHHMHENHVLHLDVKPDNVTMGDPPRLLDFSLAQPFVGPVKLRHTLGTSAYMPPEQCDHGEVTPASDLFGLGVTLYEGLTAMRPFSEGDENATDKSAQYPQLIEDAQPISDLLDVPAALDRMVMACIQRDPKRRPTSAQDVAVALEGVLESLGIQELYAWPKGLKVRG